MEVTRFVAQDQGKDALGRGTIAFVSSVGGAEKSDGENSDGANAASSSLSDVPQAQADVFEAAVIDQLIKAGYDTRTASAEPGQTAELRIIRGVAEPAEAPHKPVSGMMEVGVSNRGSMTGMGINIDLTKPRKALLSTRLEARIRDANTGAVLWEGRAEMATREGNPKWSDPEIAARLSEALFRDFPGNSGETYTAR